MPNTTSGLFETLVIPAAMEAAQAVEYTHNSINAIYWGYQIERGAEIGQTLNVNIPVVNSGDATDIQGGPLNLSDTDHTTVPIVLDHHPSASFVVKNWDKIRTPADLSTLYMNPKMESLKRLLNSYVTQLFNATVFSSYTAVVSTATNEFNRADLTGMWALLRARGVPVFIPKTLTFLTNPIVYGAMLADTNFFQAQVVGESAAVEAQQKAILAPALNARLQDDQQIGFDASATTKYIGMLLHKWGIAGVAVDPPSNAGLGGQVEETTIYPFSGAPNLGVQIQMQHSVKDGGTIINMHCFVGVKTVRPEFGVYGYTL